MTWGVAKEGEEPEFVAKDIHVLDVMRSGKLVPPQLHKKALGIEDDYC